MLLRVFIYTILLCSTSSVFAMSTDSVLAHILTKNKEHFKSSAEQLANKKEPKTFRVIAAIQENRVYNYEGNFVTQFAGDTAYYQLYPVYQKITPVESKLEKVKYSRKQRRLFKKLVGYTNLVAPNANVREMGYQAFMFNGGFDEAEIIEKLLADEKDLKVRTSAQIALWGITLRNGTRDEQLQVLGELEAVEPVQIMPVLEQYVSDNKVDKRCATIANGIISNIKDKKKFVSVAQNIFSGISLGSILLLVALGLAIVYGLGGVINMSHGEFVMIGAYTTFVIQQLFSSYIPEAFFDYYFILSIPLAFLVAGLFGLVIERLVVRHLYSKPLESLLATWGVSLVLIQLCRTIFGDVTAVKAPLFLSGGFEVMEGLMLPFNRLFIIGLTIVMVVITYLVFQKSRLGLKIRAVTQNRNMSSCLGIDTKRVDSLSFFLGSGLAGVAGSAMTLIGNVVPNMGQTYIVDSFLVVVTGGVGKLMGTIISAISIGITSKTFEFFFQAVYGKVILLVIIICFLQYKPKGLFPDKGRHAED